jgi:histone H3/H4
VENSTFAVVKNHQKLKIMKAAVKKTASKTAVKNYTPWEEIQEQYPDKFVLMKDLAFSEGGRFMGGTVVYAHKDRKKVTAKDIELQINLTTTRYTRGVRGDRAFKTFRII